jgi:hypothetical protein
MNSLQVRNPPQMNNAACVLIEVVGINEFVTRIRLEKNSLTFRTHHSGRNRS